MNNKTINQINPTEEQDCIALVKYLQLLENQGKVVKFTHIAQETYTPFRTTKARNMRMGVKPGFPDYVIIGKTKTIFIEMKRKIGGKQTIAQRDWMLALFNTKQRVFLCFGFDEAKQVVDQEL